MRDLINVLESVGLANRRPGDRWRSPRGDELIFSDLAFYPEQGGRYDTPEQFQTALDQALQSRGIANTTALQWANKPKATGGFGIAHFVDNSNRDVYLGRYYDAISPNRSENRWPNDLPSDFTLQTGAAQKEKAGYQPSEVLDGRMDDLTPEDIYQAIVAKFGQDSDEARATAAFMASDGAAEFPEGRINFAAFTNYFCEMLQPMALVMGKKRKGNADEAEARYLTGGGFGSCRISFSTKKNEGLFDSILTNAAGQSIGISTKAKGGAKASVKNLDDKVKEMQTTDDGREVLDRYPQEVSLLNLIVDGGQVGAPLNLGVLFKIISPDQRQEILSTRKLGPQQALRQLSPETRKIYDSRKVRDASKIVPFYHLMAEVAHRVADHVNANTNFSQAASAILNHGAFMQAYTKAAKSGANIRLDEFDFEYPCEAVTGVLLSAKKPYYSTGMKGNFTFQILKNGATSEEVEIEDSEVDTKPDVDLDQLDQQRAPVTARARGTVRSQDDEKTLGRKRRQPAR